MATELPAKLGLREGMRAIVIGAPAAVRTTLRTARPEMKRALRGSFAYIHLFIERENRLGPAFRRVRPHLESGGMLWISWRKNPQGDKALTMGKIIKVGYDHGLVESKCVSIDRVWSGIKFTFPQPGKTYRNKYGRLKPNPKTTQLRRTKNNRLAT